MGILAIIFSIDLVVKILAVLTILIGLVSFLDKNDTKVNASKAGIDIVIGIIVLVVAIYTDLEYYILGALIIIMAVPNLIDMLKAGENFKDLKSILALLIAILMVVGGILCFLKSDFALTLLGVILLVSGLIGLVRAAKN